MDKEKERDRLVERARGYLEAAGQPRLVMLSVLCVTLAAGFLASVAMVHLGIMRMPIRYPLAVAVAYATFIGVLWAWLQRQPPVSMLSEDPEGLLVPGMAGIGAAIAGKAVHDEGGKAKKNSWLDGNLNGLFDGGEGLGILVILVLIAIVCTLIVSIYLVVTSPLLLAELFVDGALLGAMSRAMSPSRHWSRSVLRRTWLPALVTAIVFGLVGYGIERTVPGSHTLAEAWAADKAHR